MNKIGTTESGYTVLAIPPGVESPMINHRGGEVAVDESTRTMYAWHIFVVMYGTESIMKACNSYRSTNHELH